MMYLRFILVMAVGLFGLCVVLTALLESVLANWDLAGGLEDLVGQLASKRKYVIVEDITEEDGAPKLVTRLLPERRQRERAPQAAAALPGPKSYSHQKQQKSD